MSFMPRRFVILHHTGFGREHWDLMLEGPEALWTWKLSQDPTTGTGDDIEAVRIGDHRKHYLDYEGPVSSDRGRVQRVDHGDMVWIDGDANAVTVKLTGWNLADTYRLTRIAGNRWRFGSAS